MRNHKNGFILLLSGFCVFMFFAIYFINSSTPIIVSPKKPVSNSVKTIQEIVDATPDSNREEALKDPAKVIKIDLCTGHYAFQGDDFLLLKEISQYTNLKYLELCRISIHTIPPQISSLKKLEYLHNIDGSLTSIPAPLGSLDNLKYLSLSSNRISTVADSLGDLQNLEELDLSFNPLTDFPQSILKLKKLKKLSILGTQIAVLPDGIKNMAALEELDVRSSSISQTEIDRLSKILPTHIKLIY